MLEVVSVFYETKGGERQLWLHGLISGWPWKLICWWAGTFLLPLTMQRGRVLLNGIIWVIFKAMVYSELKDKKAVSPQAYCAFGEKSVPFPYSLAARTRVWGSWGLAPGKTLRQGIANQYVKGQIVNILASHIQSLVAVFHLLKMCYNPLKM